MEQRIGHGYKFLEEMPLEELSQFKDHKRLTVFFNKGTNCSNPDCNRVGTRLICGEDRGGNTHWDVYTDDLVLMTVDHVMPKSKGGGEGLENKVPMCSPCNSRKGDSLSPGMIEDPVLRALVEMKNQSNKSHQLLKNLINTRKYNRATIDNNVYGEKLKTAVASVTKQNENFQKLLHSFIQVSIEKGVFEADDILKFNL